MKRFTLPSLVLAAAALPSLYAFSVPATSSAPATPAATPFHCQVPCGIYGDRMRIDMLMEDAATIERGMKMLAMLEQQGYEDKNQMVRWVLNKDQHAQNIQDTVASYWLAQRIKKKDGDKTRYYRQLELMHDITVAAMKCKQTTDEGHVAKLRTTALAFCELYFSADDLEHIRSHHGGGEESRPASSQPTKR